MRTGSGGRCQTWLPAKQSRQRVGHGSIDGDRTCDSKLIPAFPEVEFGIHLHTTPSEYYDKVDAAYRAGVRRFDTVLGGIGGCPMTDRELLGNLNTLSLVEYCEKNNIDHGLDAKLLRQVAAQYSF